MVEKIKGIVTAVSQKDGKYGFGGIKKRMVELAKKDLK